MRKYTIGLVKKAGKLIIYNFEFQAAGVKHEMEEKKKDDGCLNWNEY